LRVVVDFHIDDSAGVETGAHHRVSDPGYRRT
jgi:hypothetical protein